MSSKIRAWHRSLDYYLFNDQLGELTTILNQLPSVDVQAYVQSFGRLNQDFKDWLKNQGAIRFDATTGSSLMAGVIECDMSDTMATDTQALHGKVATVKPGNGGWSFKGKTLVPAIAQIYQYQPK